MLEVPKLPNTLGAWAGVDPKRLVVAGAGLPNTPVDTGVEL